MGKPHHVVIVGGGFGGLRAAQSFRNKNIQITLIDRRNFHLFQPLLYQVATGSLSPANIAAPLRSILARKKNVEVLLGEVIDLDVKNNAVILKKGHIPYDTLIVSTGSENNYFGHQHWEAHAPGLKTIEDAITIRKRILSAFEEAEKEGDPGEIVKWLTFVIIGAGPTGVELAGALAEIARKSLKHDFRSIHPEQARIILVDGLDYVLSTYPSSLSVKAELSLKKLGVEVHKRTLVSDIQPDSVTIQSGDKFDTIPTRTVLWAAGVKSSSLASTLHKKTGVELDKQKRVIVNDDLSVAGNPNIFVMGDLAHFKHGLDQPLAGVAPVAMQQGKYIAKKIESDLKAKAMKPFRYKDVGSMATIGRASGIAVIGRFRFSGYLAWLIWLFIHLMQMVRFENKVLIFLQWSWHYLTWNRSARLITDVKQHSAPEVRGPKPDAH